MEIHSEHIAYCPPEGPVLTFNTEAFYRHLEKYDYIECTTWGIGIVPQQLKFEKVLACLPPEKRAPNIKHLRYHPHNHSKVYFGWYEKDHNDLPYLGGIYVGSLNLGLSRSINVMIEVPPCQHTALIAWFKAVWNLSMSSRALKAYKREKGIR